MYSADHPQELKFQRPNKLDPGLQESVAKAGWADTLMGKALDEFLADKIPNQQLLKKLGRQLNSEVISMGPKR